MFVGELDWLKFRDLLVNKLLECKTEKDLIFLIKAMLGSMFTSERELNKARKRIGEKLLSDTEKKKIKQFKETK